MNLIDIKELSKRLSVSQKTIYKWVAENKIPHVKMPNSSVRFDPAAVDNWIKARTIKVNVAGLPT